MDSKEYIRRDDIEYRMYAPVKMMANVARSLALEDTKPSFITTPMQYFQEKRLKEKLTKNPYSNAKSLGHTASRLSKPVDKKMRST